MDIRNSIKNIISNPVGFLLHNSGIKQTIAKNTFWLALAEGITRFLKLFLIIYVARILGVTEYGKFTFALAFVTLFAIFSDFGISRITIREFSRGKEKEKEFPFLLSLKILLGIGTLFLILIVSFFITLDPVIRGVIWILGIYTIITSFSSIIYAFFQARQKMEYEAWGLIIQAIIVTGAGFFVLFNFPSVKNLSLSYLFASLITLIFILFLFNFKIYKLKLSFNKKIWQNYLAISWPLALIGVFSAIYNQTDSIMMGYWGQITETGWYNAAYKIMGVTLIPAGLIGASFYPVLSKLFKESKEKLQNAWNYYMDATIFLTIPLVIGGIALAPRIIDFVYDPRYNPSILAFQILIITGGIMILSNPFNTTLVIWNYQRKVFWVVLSGAIVNVVLNLILIPQYSLYGAAFTTLITVFLIFFLSLRLTLKLTSIKPLNWKSFLTFINSLIASIPMYFVIIRPSVYNANVFLSVFLGIITYGIFFFIFKTIIGKLKLCKNSI